MALQLVRENSSNKLALETFPHLRTAQVEDGYDFGTGAGFGPNGETIVNPLLYPADPDLDSVSPRGWTGTTQVSHGGKVVFQPGGGPAERNTAAYTEGFQKGQDELFESAMFEQMEKDPVLLEIAQASTNPATLETAKRFKDQRLKKRLMIGGGVAVALIASYFIYFRFIG